MTRNSLAHRMSTHAAQRPPEEMMQEALRYLEVMIPIVNNVNCSPNSTVNMDQTPMWHVMMAKGTIDAVGKCTINARLLVTPSASPSW